MKKNIFLISIFIFAIFTPVVLAQTTTQEEIDYYSLQVQESQNKASTLKETLKYFDTSIVLNQKDTEQIENIILDDIVQSKLVQVPETGPFAGLSWKLFLTYPFDSLNRLNKNIFTKTDKQAQEEAIVKANTHKKEIESLITRLGLQRKQLELLKNEKEYLLTLTQNDEKKYQELLQNAQNILIAQQAIFAGKAQETKIGTFKQGAKIATIISGSSTCSTGTHLHFEVRNKNVAVDPTKYLSAVQFHWTLMPLHVVQFSGNWTWPITTPVVLTQEFGMSWYAKPGGFSMQGGYGGDPHTGLDMYSESANQNVLAPVDGTLYFGKTSCGGGYLSYVRLQKSDETSLYFLHTTR